MKYVLSFLFLLSIRVFSQDTLPGTDKLYWMCGCWEKVSDNYSASEMWMEPAGGTMLGMGHVIRDGKTASYEFMIIQKKNDGKIYLTAKPSGQEEASFLLTKMTSNEVIFENAAHDYPQLISYRLNERGKLIAYVSGKINNENRSFSIEMTRKDCLKDDR